MPGGTGGTGGTGEAPEGVGRESSRCDHDARGPYAPWIVDARSHTDEP